MFLAFEYLADEADQTGKNGATEENGRCKSIRSRKKKEKRSFGSNGIGKIEEEVFKKNKIIFGFILIYFSIVSEIQIFQQTKSI